MLAYCLMCKINTENVNSKVLNTKNDKTGILSKFVVCSSKSQDLWKNQEHKDYIKI